MMQSAGLVNILQLTNEPSNRTVSAETATRQPSTLRHSSPSQTEEKNTENPIPTASPKESSDSPFLTVLNKKLGKKDANPPKKSSPDKQEDLSTTTIAEIIYEKQPAANLLTEKTQNHPKSAFVLNSQKNQEKISPILTTLPNLLQKSSKTAFKSGTIGQKISQEGKPNPKETTNLSSHQKTTVPEENNKIETDHIQNKNTSRLAIPIKQKAGHSSNGQDLSPQELIKERPSISPQQSQRLQPTPLTANTPTMSLKNSEKTSPATSNIHPSKSQKSKSSLQSDPSYSTHGKKEISNTDLSVSLSDLGRTQHSSEIGSSSRPTITINNPVVHGPSKAMELSTTDPNAPLSASQQVLRSLQSAIQSDFQSVQITLTPSGLGTVRITFEKNGEEIYGTLLVQKDQTRQEIEKSIPNILASLDSQGIQIRKIEVNQMPNQEQRQPAPDSSGDWTLRYEMSEERQHRFVNTDSTSPNGQSDETNVKQEINRSSRTHPDSQLLNLYI